MKLTSILFALGTLSAAFGQATAPTSPRLVCLFLDLNSMSAADQAKAQEAATQFIQDRAAPSDLVEIATYTSKLNVIQDFTGDHQSLISAIKNLEPVAAGLADQDGRIEAIQAAAASLNRFPAQKALVYISTPVAAGSAQDESNREAVVNAARRANVQVYSIDPSQQ